MIKSILIILTLFNVSASRSNFYLPIKTSDRQSVNSISLTIIGEFGLVRKERPGIPAHFHTGIDIKRPTSNYQDEPVYSIYEGTVISVRQDGPYAQLIIEHGSSQKFWTVYEHVAGIKVRLNEQVTPNLPIARFMNMYELNKYGWQFDHVHFEILKIKPIKIKPDNSNRERHYSSYSLLCLTKNELNKYFYNPIEFLSREFIF
jgi:murein DD-endopeptidase MepM/ murein hydrolase activator NlpD